MKNQNFKNLSAWFLADPNLPRRIGTASISSKNAISFRYCDEWISHGFSISPDLPIERQNPQKEFVPQNGESSHGAIDDSMPDRWGQQVIRLIDNPDRLLPLDFLYLAGDNRFGALGFSISDQTYEPYPLPPLPSKSSISEVAELIEKIANREHIGDRESLLLSSSKTMGGARPKMLVNINGEEWIAKFSKGDFIDLPLIEHASMLLAQKAGIRVADTEVFKIQSGHVLLVKRFDRTQNKRIHCLSAKSMLFNSIRPSYVGMANVLRTKQPKDSLDGRPELFLRFAFNVLLDNTDDHEKNHAFMQNHDGSWSLSAAYDILPQTNGTDLRGMTIGAASSGNHRKDALNLHAAFGITHDQAIELWEQVAKTIISWKDVFHEIGVSQNDIDYLSSFLDSERLIELRFGKKTNKKRF